MEAMQSMQSKIWTQIKIGGSSIMTQLEVDGNSTMLVNG